MFGIAGKMVAAIAVIGGFAVPRVRASIVSRNELPFRQQVNRELEGHRDPGVYGSKGPIREIAISSTPVTDCVFTTSESGNFIVEADGSEKVCGIYVFTEPERIVEISFPRLDVPCGSSDIVAVVDGWELNGQIFPSEADHPLPLRRRFSEFCGMKNDVIFLSSQNVGLVQYRIGTVGKGFVVTIDFRKNRQPCNALASSDAEPVTLRNYGRRVNCTLMTIYPAVVRTVALDVGNERVRGSTFRNAETGTVHQCDRRGGIEDFAQIGGTDGLDTSRLEILDAICGLDSKPSAGESKIIGCGVTSVRLVSSGKYKNSVTIVARPADPNQLLDAHLTCALNAIH